LNLFGRNFHLKKQLLALMINERDIEKRPLTIEDLQDIETLSAASISMDGRWLVYVTTKVIIEEDGYRDFITIVNLQTKEQKAVWEGAAPQWSAVSNQVAYLANYKGVSYIWSYSLDDDLKKPLAPIHESHYFMGHQALKNFAWAPNGRYIAYVSTEASVHTETGSGNVKVIDRLLYKTKGGRGRPPVADEALSHIWLVDVNGGKPQLLTTGVYNEHSLAWSPDSARLAFISNRSGNPDNNQLYDLWSVDIKTKKVVRYTENFGSVHQPSWSPDGKWIAFLGTRSKVNTNDSPAEDTHLYLVFPDGATIQCLTKALDRRIEQISWHPQKEVVYFTAGDKGTTAIYQVAVSTRNIKKVVGENCHILEYAISKRSNTICYTGMDSTHPTEIYLYDEELQLTQQFSNNHEQLLQKCCLQGAEPFWFKSFDDLEVQGWIIKPASFNALQQYPLVLVIHGGPHNMFGYDFEDRMQLLAAKGYGVLYINPRGSHGYGQAFSSGCVLNWGGDDYKDLMAGVDAALAQNDWIDAARLGVTGQSYGGYMSNWIITQTNRFRAAVVDGGISNLVSFAGTSLYHSLLESEFNGSAYDNFPLLWQWSPLRSVKNVTTPTLFLHGEVDNEVPISQAEEMYIALKKLGVESRFVQYLGEGHGWRPDLKPKNRYDLLRRMLEWFDHYLKPDN
jgi:dipeptidyl aminopeptidase/acylaminoacyl peptidase